MRQKLEPLFPGPSTSACAAAGLVGLAVLCTLGALGALGGCEPQVPIETLAAAPPGPPLAFPTLDQIYTLSSHNSYFAGNVPEAFASGTNQRISDVLLFEHAGMIEIDVHKAEPGRWRVYHTVPNPGLNTQCEYLDDCLMRVQALHYALPLHEIVIVHIELKHTEPVVPYRPSDDIFDAEHTPEQLDQIIRRYLAPALYQPAEYMGRAACRGAATLLECGERAGWPTIDTLRGRFLVSLAGNWSVNHYNWARYAGEGDIKARAAFPLRSVFNTCGSGQADGGKDLLGRPWFPGREIPAELLARARQNSVLWEIKDAPITNERGEIVRAGVPLSELPDQPCGEQLRRDGEQLRRAHGLLRSLDVDTRSRQIDALRSRYNYLLTDWSWAFVEDGPRVPTSYARDPARRLYDPAWVRGGEPIPVEALREPGQRLQFYSYSARDALFRFRRTTGPATWETVVSSGALAMPSNAEQPVPRGSDGSELSRGDACLRLESEDGAEWVALCRRLLTASDRPGEPSDDPTRLVLTVRGVSGEEGAFERRFYSSRGSPGDGLGEMLRLAVQPRDGGSEVTAAAAGRLQAEDLTAPDYRVLHRLRFRGALPKQGLYAEGDKLFVRTRLVQGSEAIDINLCDLPEQRGDRSRSGVIDASWPASCPSDLPPSPRPTL
jgi:hypothetical protein